MEYSKNNFDNIEIEKAARADYIKLNVTYINNKKVYGYIRKVQRDESGTYAIINGYKIRYNNKYIIYAIEKYYETKGHKRLNAELETTTAVETELLTPVVATTKVSESSAKHSEYTTIKQCIKANVPVYLEGPAGSGKNYTIQQIAAKLKLDFYFTNSVQQEYKLTGFIDAGGTYHETEFYKAFKNGGLFFLDELDASIPEVLVLLNAAIANRYFEFPNGRIEAHKKFRVIAAGNTIGHGANEQYTGRQALDAATLDRFVIIHFDYEKPIELKMTNNNTQLVDYVHALRHTAQTQGIQITLSYRCLQYVTKLEKKNMPINKIMQIVIFKGLSLDDIRTLMPSIVLEDNKYARAHKALAA